MTEEKYTRPRQPRRIARYGGLVRGWSWRTTPELLERADATAQRLGIDRTELLEQALLAFMEANPETPPAP